MNLWYALFAVGVVEATHRLMNRWERKHRLELEALEREALDATIRWAYSHGLMQTFGEDYEVVVHEFRSRWGDERREVRR